MSETSREDIIAFSCKEMLNVGVKSLSVDDIATKLGMSKKTFYSHFTNKEELLEAVLAYLAQTHCTQLDDIEAHWSVLEVFTNLIRLYERGGDFRHNAAFVYDVQKYYPRLYGIYVSELQSRQRQFLVHFLRTGQTTGIVRSDLDVEGACGLIECFHDAMLTHRDENLLGPALDMFLHGVLSEQGREEIKMLMKGI